MSEITTTHKGIKILYDEAKNRWEFELRGRDRFASTLALARDAIDKPPPKETPAFTPVECHSKSFRGWEIVRVTSVASDEGYNNAMVWVSAKDKSRSKESSHQLYPVGMGNNDKIVKQWKEIEEQKKILLSKLSDLESKLTPLTIKEEKE